MALEQRQNFTTVHALPHTYVHIYLGKWSITWFNLRAVKHVAANIGEKFQSLLDTCFQAWNHVHKYLNRHTVKTLHPTATGHWYQKTNRPTNCNCWRGKRYPPDDDGYLQIRHIISRRNDNTSQETSTYIWLADNTFKTRSNADTRSCRNGNKGNTSTILLVAKGERNTSLCMEEIIYRVQFLIVLPHQAVLATH